MKFYLAICQNKFFVYREDKTPESFESGNPYLEYEPSKIREAIKQLVHEIVDGNNQSSKEDLQFVLIKSTDNVINSAVENELRDLVINGHEATKLVNKVLLQLAKDPKLYIKELGVNYDGECYHLDDNGPMWRNEYSLLALSIDSSELLKFVS